MSGQAGSRGYLIQALICVLDALNGDWDTLTIEPEEDSNKVDICWDKRRAIQVKSSQNSISVIDAKRWSRELSESNAAEQYELHLIGPVSAGVTNLKEYCGVTLPTPQPLNLPALTQQAAHKLDCYLVSKGTKYISPAARELMVEALTCKLFLEGTSGNPVAKEDFDQLLMKWIGEIQPNTANNFSNNIPQELPSPPADFVGRSQEISTAKQLLNPNTQYLVVSGMGGIGKTTFAIRLCQELGQNYPDGHIFVEMGGSENPKPPDQVMSSIMNSLGEGGVASTSNNTAASYRTTTHSKKLLIFLDNAAHKDQIEPLRAGPNSLLVVTTRVNITLPGMASIDLSLMPKEDCNTLINSINPRIDAYAPDLAKLCGYLPLAMRIASSTLRERSDISPPEYMEQLCRIGKRSELIEASIELSIKTLPEQVRQFFYCLASFPQHFDFSAASTVTDMSAEITSDNLGHLLRHNLVTWTSDLGRYNLHDLVRDYARKFSPAETISEASTRHSIHYLGVAQESHDLYQLGGANVFEALELFDLERSNITGGFLHSAANSQDSKGAAQICNDYLFATSLCRELRFSSHEQGYWINKGITASQTLEDFSAFVMHLGNLGRTLKDLGEYDRAIECQNHILELSRKNNINEDVARALLHISHALIAQKKYTEALANLEQALEATLKTKDDDIELYIRNSLHLCHRELGHYPEARQHLDHALQLITETSDPRPVMMILLNGGSFLTGSTDPEAAIDMLTHAKNIAEDLHHTECVLKAILAIGDVYLADRSYLLARESYEQLNQLSEKYSASTYQEVAEAKLAYIRDLSFENQ